jgi:hypothetical protein
MGQKEHLVSLEHGLAMLALRINSTKEAGSRESSGEPDQAGVSIPRALSMAYLHQTKLKGEYTQ